jgi:histidyl-tRNA synthetase
MSKQKPSLAKGTRDYSPAVMMKRQYIIDIIRNVFQRFGFMPLETPAMENLSVLMGKYGEEGDQLLFKILNSGDFLKNTRQDDLAKGYKALTLKIAEKGLRYDLTVPFARFVAMNQNDLAFPFKRYQIQPVWRGDSPQRGRYREFYQCDADVVGTESLICEAEIVLMINEVLTRLGIPGYQIKINNRKILAGIVEVIGAEGKETELCVAIDKLDKIGKEQVIEELRERDFGQEAIQKVLPVFDFGGDLPSRLQSIGDFLKDSAIGQQGLAELKEVLMLVSACTGSSIEASNVVLDITLARGLSYYTGAIFEVKVNNTAIGSISGGGRYDNLTGTFGLPDVTGVGFSFGLDRIYDVMEEFELFPEATGSSTQVLLSNFDKAAEQYALPLLQQLRAAGINAEIYPTATKLDKQLKYANKKAIPFMILIGEDEIQSGLLAFKDMRARTQQALSLEEIIQKVQEK